jgi:hypothetical protein
MRKFKNFIHDRQSPVSKAGGRNLKEEVDNADIADATVTIIGSELSVTERQLISTNFINDIQTMTNRGLSIIAMAVVLE